MSHSTGPLDPESPERLSGAQHELRRRGRAFGVEYDIGLRITAMPGVAPSSFTDAVRAAADELRLEPLSPPLLNQIGARVDQLGRRVHGLGWTRDHEIGGCLTAAVSELSRAREQPEADRSETVRRALRQLERALTHMDEGLRPR